MIFGWDNNSVTSVTIPDGVTSISGSAFNYCDGLSSVTIPESVISIRQDSYTTAFYGCANLTNIDVAAANPFFSSIDGILFDKTGTALLAFPGGRADAAHSLPGGMTQIANAAFGGVGLTSVTIPEGVTRIGHYAFYGCQQLTSVTIPSSLTSIGERVFSGPVNVLFKGAPPTTDVFGPPFIWFSVSDIPSVYYLPSLPGWGSLPHFGGVGKQPFIPTAQGSRLTPASGFQFTWTGTGSILMNVRRATSPGGPWTVVATGISAAEFTDPNPPSGKAFYQAFLP